MAYSVQKSRLAKVAGVSLVLLLAACSSDSRYKRQVSGDESYLDAAPLAEPIPLRYWWKMAGAARCGRKSSA